MGPFVLRPLFEAFFGEQTEFGRSSSYKRSHEHKSQCFPSHNAVTAVRLQSFKTSKLQKSKDDDKNLERLSDSE